MVLKQVSVLLARGMRKVFINREKAIHNIHVWIILPVAGVCMDDG